MRTEIRKYGNRNWAIYLIGGAGEHEEELIAVTVYKKGAASVAAITNALIKARATGHQIPARVELAKVA